MGFNKTFFHILLRVLLLLTWIFGLVYTYETTDLVISPIMLGLLALISVLELTWFLRRQERNWIEFLDSVRYQDFSRIYQKHASKELSEAYELITQSMEQMRSDKQAEYRLLQTVLGHISIGVLCYRSDGQVVFTNKAFDTLLGIPGLIDISKIEQNYPKIFEVVTRPHTNPSDWIDHKNGQKLFVKTESFKLQSISHQLVSLADIRSSLDSKELESYQKLMRVMTHEIMNSANPILSLIRVVNNKLIAGDELKPLSPKEQGNMVTSLQAIEERTSGILKFVTSYKKINQLIQPLPEKVKSSALLQSIESIMQQEPGAELVITDHLNDHLWVDVSLIHQVLINLITNAIHAVEEGAEGKVHVNIRQENNTNIIEVIDNGPGVSNEALHQIFVPFFTTKKKGSGIGLALSRKIVKAHGGTLAYERNGNESHFIIQLPVS